MTSSPTRAVIMDLLKQKFGGFTIWTRVETDIALMCSDLPEPTNEDKKNKLVEGLKQIKTYLLEKSVEEEDLQFLDEELERYENTRQISLYMDEDDQISDEVVEKYARLGYGSEGIVGIHLGLNYNQLKRLTNGVYKKTGLIKFYISRETTIYGKIIAECFRYPKKITIATLAESKKKVEETGLPLFKRIFLFGELPSKKDYSVIKSIDEEFYIYRFISIDKRDFILMSTKKVEVGDYIVTGVVTHIEDKACLTESAKLTTKLPFFFAQNCKNRIVKFDNHEEFRKRLSFLKVNKSNIFDFPFTVQKNGNQYVLKNLDWFKWMMWAWLTHTPVGLFNNYPLHLLIIGPPHSGKSLLLNCLHARSQESGDIFSGSSSTMKNLIPSFWHDPAKIGYLGESNRFSYCDEFLRCIFRARNSTQEQSGREEGVALMNDLLEHQKREAGSGIAKVTVNMTSRIIATTNPIRGINNVTDLTKRMDGSFLSRLLVLYQSDEQVRQVRDSKDVDLKTLDYKMDDNDWVSIVDYLQSFNAEYDMDRVEEIKNSVLPVLNEDLLKHYDSRHLHHIECLMDGIVKTRCLMDKDMKFKAIDRDYEVLEVVWKNIIKSWTNALMIRNLPVQDRIFYLPETCQSLYWAFEKLKREMTTAEIKELGLGLMTKNEFFDAIQILTTHKLIIETQGLLKPHCLK